MAEKTRWFEKAVVYQIYPFSFMDSNNDGYGDIEGIISKLDYVQNLGVTAIWFSPLYDSADYDYGYDIRDYRKIAAKFGDLSTFQRLVEECHKRDLKVIMDMVINHTCIEHEWFQKAISSENNEYRDYYIIRKGIRKGKKLLPPTNWTSSFTGSAWERIGETDDFYLHLFTKEQPDLNWENPKVRQEIVDILNYWMDMGVDGFRFDVFNLFSKVYPFVDDKHGGVQKGIQYFVDGPRMHEFLHELNVKALGIHDSYTVGETYLPNEEHAYRYVKKDNEELDSVFHFEHMASDNIGGLKFFKKPFDLIEFKGGFFAPQRKYYHDGWNTLVLENHDNTRSNSRFGIDVKKFRYEASTMLPLITFMGFGIPYIYMGQEIGMTAVDFTSMDQMKDPVSHSVYDLLCHYHMPKKLAFSFINYGARDHARVPMQWDASVNAGFNTGATPWQCMNSNYKEINVEKDLKSDKSIYRFYQKLIAFKKENDVAIYGDVSEYDHDNRQIIAYTREWEGKGLFIVGNFSPREASYTIPTPIATKALTPEIYNYDTLLRVGNELHLRPYEAVLFSYNYKH